jgi:hypothetical protein
MKLARGIRLLIIISMTLVVADALVSVRSSALPYGSGTYGSCQYDTCSISLSTSSTVSLPVTPTFAGVYTTQKDDVVVGTHASTGYTLTMKDSDTSTNLVSGGDSVPRSSGTQASPISLVVNTWGYRVDGLSGFGAGPTSAQTNSASSTYTFAGVPASNETTHTIKTTSAAAEPAETTAVWYGIFANGSVPSGTYTDTVTYTAVTNS